MGSWNERPNAELQGRMSEVVALAVLAAWPRGGTLSAAWHRHVFNHGPWMGPQTVLHKFFCGASLKAKWALNKKGLKKQSWKVWSIYVRTSWTTVVFFFLFWILFHSEMALCKGFCRIWLRCSKYIHANTSTHMAEFIFEYLKNSKQQQ